MPQRIKINIQEKLNQITELFSPKIIAQFNNHDIKIVKSKGDFTWHTHHETDELFWLLKGKLAIRYRDKDIVLEPGEMTVVPKGIEHTTEALEPCETVIIELSGTLNTGDKENEFTATEDHI